MTCKWEGKHKGHRISFIKTASNFIKEELKESIHILEKESQALVSISQKAEGTLIKNIRMKELTKKQVTEYFDKMSKILDEKRAEALAKVEEIHFGEDIELPFNAKTAIGRAYKSLKEGNGLLSKWDDDVPVSTIDRAITVINESKILGSVKNTYVQLSSYDIDVNLNNIGDDANRILQEISNISSVRFINTHLCGPTGLTLKTVGYLFAIIEWEKSEENDKFVISVQKEDISKEREYMTFECNESRFVVTLLEPDTKYLVNVKVKRGSIESKWSDAIKFKTLPFETEKMLLNLNAHYEETIICTEALELIKNSKKYSKNFFV